jgi:hypothetical protein
LFRTVWSRLAASSCNKKKANNTVIYRPYICGVAFLFPLSRFYCRTITRILELDSTIIRCKYYFWGLSFINEFG